MATKTTRTITKKTNGLRELIFIKGLLKDENPDWFTDDGVIKDEPLNLLVTKDNLTVKEYIRKRKLDVDVLYLNIIEDTLVWMSSFSNTFIGTKQVPIRLKNTLQTVNLTYRTFTLEFLDSSFRGALVTAKMEIEGRKKIQENEDDEN